MRSISASCSSPAHLAGKGVARRELPQVVVVEAFARLAPLDPELLLLIVEVLDDGLRLGSGKRLGDHDHGVQRKVHLAVPIAVAEEVQVSRRGLEASAVEDALQLVLVHRRDGIANVGADSPVLSRTALAASQSALSYILAVYSPSRAAAARLG